MPRFTHFLCRSYVSRSWPNPGTRGEQVRSMYDRLKDALSKEEAAKEALAKEASLKESDTGGNGSTCTGQINGQVTEPK